jgi:DNA-binding LytR/AlgR family response regulator
MLNTIIIEDERPARAELQSLLHRMEPDVHVMAALASVQESILFLNQVKDADLIFSDIQLSDGLSFEIFKHTNIRVPVIFITGFDEFMMNAFECNGIDYLLKPVDEKDLACALKKYKMLQEHFTLKENEIGKLVHFLTGKKKSRLLVSKGMEHISLRTDDIAILYTENKIVYAIDNTGKKYLADRNLSELEQELDDTIFFRVNRQYIINVNYIRGFRSYEKVKLQVDMVLPELNDKHFIIISQETAPAFRKWIYEA